jgi:hypothetical protein
MLSGYGQMF